MGPRTGSGATLGCMELLLAEWEVACCTPLPVAGERWAAPLVLYRTAIRAARAGEPDGLRGDAAAATATGPVLAVRRHLVSVDLGGGRSVGAYRFADGDHTSPPLAVPEADRLTITGRLTTTMHGGDDVELPSTELLVRRVRWARQQVRQTGRRTFEVVGHDPGIGVDTVPESERGDGDYLVEFTLAAPSS